MRLEILLMDPMQWLNCWEERLYWIACQNQHTKQIEHFCLRNATGESCWTLAKCFEDGEYVILRVCHTSMPLVDVENDFVFDISGSTHRPAATWRELANDGWWSSWQLWQVAMIEQYCFCQFSIFHPLWGHQVLYTEPQDDLDQKPGGLDMK